MQVRALRASAVIAACAVSAPAALAHPVILPFVESLVVDSPVESPRGFGGTIAAAPDLDGDGVSDLLVGQQLVSSLGADPSSAWAISGATGAMLFPIQRVDVVVGPLAFATLEDRRPGGGSIIAVTDRVPSADTNPDAAVTFCSAADGARLRTTAIERPAADLRPRSVFGLVNAGDIDGDGVDDVVAGGAIFFDATGAASGVLVAISGASGSVLWRRDFEGQSVGARLITIADRTGDGLRDLAASANSVGDPVGAVALLNAADGDTIGSIQAPTDAWPSFGVALAETTAGDLAIGDSQHPSGSGRGRVTVHDLDTGAVVRTIFINQPGLFVRNFGFALLAGEDFSGDGAPDIVVGAPGGLPYRSGAPQSVFVVDEATGAIQYAIAGTLSGEPNGDIGHALAPVIGAGQRSVAIGAPSVRVGFSFTNPTGRLYIVAPLDACYADLTGDGVVDGADLGQLVGRWGSDTQWGGVPFRDPANYDADIFINSDDLTLLIANWGLCAD
jgi:hypothetical protein